MPDLPFATDTTISRLAREVAREIRPIAEIRESFQLSTEGWDEIIQTEAFKQRLTEELAIWNASDPKSIAERIGSKAATMVEECLAEVYALIHDRTQPMAAKIEALKWASRISGIENNSSVRPGEGDDPRVRITINIGTDKIQFDKERALPPKVIEGDLVELTPEVAR